MGEKVGIRREQFGLKGEGEGIICRGKRRWRRWRAVRIEGEGRGGAGRRGGVGNGDEGRHRGWRRVEI